MGESRAQPCIGLLWVSRKGLMLTTKTGTSLIIREQTFESARGAKTWRTSLGEALPALRVFSIERTGKNIERLSCMSAPLFGLEFLIAQWGPRKPTIKKLWNSSENSRF